ncbi:uncharacterized protein LOC119981843 [Tripterygium wilfordii]|uniref:uncharacterized protein LOC119981843 n=1 Tax=Tripterygium wilfordii TaxID=458696 RepID=UPI0018F8051C|nr:uncharacterized protein LOC119981843 [Tripterygium wilfordii]
MKKDTVEVLWSAQKKAKQSLRKMTSTPFVRALRLEDPPNKFSPPAFAVYDGKTDPVAHISTYTHKMALWASRDELICKMFSSSLGITAMKWFHQLPENLVSSWRELAQIIVTRFIANSRDLAILDTLFALHLRKGESLRAYAVRIGLNNRSNWKKTSRGIDSLLLRKGQKKKENKKFENKNGQEKDSKKDPKPSSYEVVKTIFKDPIFQILPQIADKLYFLRPNKMSGDPSTRNQSKWCSYHRDKCHRTEDCREFKRHLEELVQQGHFKEFIDKEKTAAEKKAEP